MGEAVDLKFDKPLQLVVCLLMLVVFSFLSVAKYIFMPVYRLIFAAKLPLTLRTPESRFQGLDKQGYPFKPNYVDLPAGGGVTLPRVHYVDEGNKDASKTILCLHGEPSWSFLYRHMIPILVKAGYRVVAPDFIGFGKSDKYTSMINYTHEMHTSTLRLLMEHLELENVTLVCQDWGGLIGLTVVKDIPERFSSLVIMNTGLPTGDIMGDIPDISLSKALKLGIPFLMWCVFSLFLGRHIPVGWIFKRLNDFPDAVCDAYAAPFPDSSYKAGVAKWPLLVPLFKDAAVTPHMVSARAFLSTWSKPTLIMFGDSDPITRGQEKMFKRLIPTADEITVKNATHFLQEKHGEELANNIVHFLQKK